MEFPVNATIKIMHKEAIKPFSPTPTNKRILKLSLLDQFATATYVGVIFFYPTNGKTTTIQISQTLKTSLSKTLTHFYPLAGRLKDNSFIDCNDIGATFIEAHAPCCLSDVLKSPDADAMQQFLPVRKESEECVTGALLQIQVNFFSDFGFAIGVCASHKITDAATLTTFINCWSAIARDDHSNEMNPLYVGDSLIPQLEISIPVRHLEFAQGNCKRKRCVFDASKIAALKAKADPSVGIKPTRVEVVLALIWKCLIKASRTNKSQQKPSVMSIPVNLRKRFVPPLMQNYAGNYLGMIIPQIHEQNANEMELKDVLGKLKQEIKRVEGIDVTKILTEGDLFEIFNEYASLIVSDDVDFYTCTSWCKFDLYDADFGWERPAWISLTGSKLKNIVLLMDTKDGQGIEAWLNLDEDEMTLLEYDQELLQFATFNPTVSF